MKKYLILLFLFASISVIAQPGKERIEKPGREVPEGPQQPKPPAITPINEGGVYQEVNDNKIYVIQNGKKVLIPTISALWLMGYNQSQVVTVTQGRLNVYPTFIITSSSPTPGSIVFPPNDNNNLLPLQINTATKIYSRGKEIQLLELRGWLRDIGGGSNVDAPSLYKCAGNGADMHYGLELDIEWAEQVGLDIHKLLRVGNIVTGLENHNQLLHPAIPFNYSKAVSIPMIRVELNSWGWTCHFPGTMPADWVSNVMPDKPNIFWPFPPYKTYPVGEENKNIWQRGFELDVRGPYVRMVGSIVTDNPHDDGGWRHFLANGEWSDVVFRWGSNPKTDPNHPARWAEMHPPDYLESLPYKTPVIVTRGVGFSALPTQTEMLEFDIFPEADGIMKPSQNSRVTFSESTGPESVFPRGRNNDNGIFITKFDDHIHVKASIQGSTDLLGSSGRLKSIIKIWWEQYTPIPAPPPPPPRPMPGIITGNWEGTSGTGISIGPNFYSFLLMSNGNMKVLDVNGNIIASGKFSFSNNRFSTTYTYTNGSTFSAAATLITLNGDNQLTGTWGSGTNISGGGKWIMSKQ